MSRDPLGDGVAEQVPQQEVTWLSPTQHWAPIPAEASWNTQTNELLTSSYQSARKQRLLLLLILLHQGNTVYTEALQRLITSLQSASYLCSSSAFTDDIIIPVWTSITFIQESAPTLRMCRLSGDQNKVTALQQSVWDLKQGLINFCCTLNCIWKIVFKITNAV